MSVFNSLPDVSSCTCTLLKSCRNEILIDRPVEKNEEAIEAKAVLITVSDSEPPIKRSRQGSESEAQSDQSDQVTEQVVEPVRRRQGLNVWPAHLYG